MFGNAKVRKAIFRAIVGMLAAGTMMSVFIVGSHARSTQPRGELNLAPLLDSNFDAYEKVIGPPKQTDKFSDWDAQNRYYKFPGLVRIILHRQGSMQTPADLWDRVSWIKVQFRPGKTKDWKEALERVGLPTDAVHPNNQPDGTTFLTGVKPDWTAHWTPHDPESKTDQLEIDKFPSNLFMGADGKTSPETILAHFDFNGTANDERSDQQRFGLRNTTFKDNALYLNGIYDGRPDWSEAGAYRTLCDTQQLDYSAFTVAVRFKSEEFSRGKTNLITGGYKYRWFGLERSAAGNLTVTLNNAKFSNEIQTASLPVGQWTLVVCGVDILHRKIIVYLNGTQVANIDLPNDFQLEVAASIKKETIDPSNDDKKWTFTNYSNGNVFHGLVDELIIYGKMLSPDEFKQPPGLSSSR